MKQDTGSGKQASWWLSPERVRLSSTTSLVLSAKLSLHYVGSSYVVFESIFKRSIWWIKSIRYRSQLVTDDTFILAGTGEPDDPSTVRRENQVSLWTTSRWCFLKPHAHSRKWDQKWTLVHANCTIGKAVIKHGAYLGTFLKSCMLTKAGRFQEHVTKYLISS